jgi:glycosyltransferase involved in cell wall biosynthesis
MPTCNRRQFAAQAITYFLRQEYPCCELIILDDGDDAIQDLVPDDPRVRYVRLGQRMVLGAKRNLACTLAQGSIIAHWDDDDWMAPHRLRYQVDILEARHADLCGSARLLYYDACQERAWLYEYPIAQHRWVVGGTLCYRKQFWDTNRFPDIKIGEDTRFVWSPRARNVAVTPESHFYVGLMHTANTSAKMTNGAYWKAYPVADVRRLMGDDWDFYQLLKVSSTLVS